MRTRLGIGIYWTSRLTSSRNLDQTMEPKMTTKLCNTTMVPPSTLFVGWYRLRPDSESSEPLVWPMCSTWEERRMMVFVMAFSSTCSLLTSVPNRTVDVSTCLSNHGQDPFPQYLLSTSKGYGFAKDVRSRQYVHTCALYTARRAPTHASRAPPSEDMNIFVTYPLPASCVDV